MPTGYEEMTVAQIADGAKALEPADARGRARVRAESREAQGRLSALESALKAKEESA